MTKRQMWILNCLLWAGIWFFLGVLFPPFWLLTVLSLAVILLPVGVIDNPQTHNPEKWGTTHANESRSEG